MMTDDIWNRQSKDKILSLFKKKTPIVGALSTELHKFHLL